MEQRETSTGRSVQFFSAANLSETAGGGHGPDAADLALAFRNDEDRDVILAGSALFAPHMKSFAAHFEDVQMHIGVIEFAPGLMTPLHCHSDDCAYYVERGSAIMGNRVIGPGEGFLVRKDQPYGFASGPEGLRLIEFTHGPRRDINFLERNPKGWLKRLEKVISKLVPGEGE